MMVESDLLSQEEIDALLSKVNDGDIETSTDTPPTEGVVPFDFSNLDHIIRGRMPAVEIINERFAREFRVSLFNMLRRNCDVSIVGIKVQKFSDYLQNLLLPTSLNMVRVKPLRGVAIFVFDPKLVFSLVDCYFGGGGSGYSKIEGRDFSASEMRVVRIALDACFEKMIKAWSVVKSLEFEYLYSEVNPQFANIASPSETVISSVFRIELDQVGGELIFTMPNSMIDPLRQQLVAGIQSDKSDIDERWVASLRSEILAADVGLTAVLAEFQTTLGQVSGWQQGDIIPIPEPEKILLRSDYVPVCHGSPGSSEGHYAIQIDSFVQPGTTTEGAGEILHSLNT